MTNPGGLGGARTIWGLLDQATWSVGNLVLVLLVASSASGAEFGAFSAVYGLTLAGVGLGGGITHESTLLSEAGRRKVLRPAAFGLAVVFGVALAVVLLVASLPLSGVRAALIGFAIAAVPVALNETARGHLNLEGRTRFLFNIDLLWTSLSILVVWLLARANAGVGAMAASWGLVSLPSTLLALRALRCRPQFRSIRAYLSDRGATGLSYSSEYLVSSGLAQLLSPLVAALAGLQAAGVLRLLQVAFGPFTSLTSGLRLVVTPQLREHHNSGQPLRKLVVGMSAALAAVACAFGLLLWVLPVATGEQYAGELWPEARSLLEVAVPHRILIAFALGAAMAARAKGVVRESRHVRIVLAAITLAMASAGARLDGPRGVLVGLLITQVIAIALWLALLQRNRLSSEGVP